MLSKFFNNNNNNNTSTEKENTSKIMEAEKNVTPSVENNQPIENNSSSQQQQQDEAEEEEGCNTDATKYWTYGSENIPVYTIYYQGMSASQLGLSRYTGSWGFHTTTGANCKSPMALEIIGWPFVGVESQEVVLSPMSYDPSLEEYPALCRHPLLWFGSNIAEFMNEMFGCRAVPSACCTATALATDRLHGLHAGEKPPNSLDASKHSVETEKSKDEATKTVLDRYPFGPDPMLTVRHHVLRMDRMNFGQSRDILTHKQKWLTLQRWHRRQNEQAKHIKANEKGKQKIHVLVDEADYSDRTGEKKEKEMTTFYPSMLFGVSRGAATTLNAMAEHNYQNVRLIFLEGCYDDILSVLNAKFPWIPSVFVEAALTATTEYRPGAIQPIDSVQNISTDVPIAFVTSRVDNITPVKSTLRLINKLRNECGHEKIHFLQLRFSRHGKYTITNEIDCKAYTCWAHALKRKYNLPYLAEYADQGEPLLNEDPESEDGQDAWFRRECERKYNSI